MKKILLLGVVAFVLSSCTVHRASVVTTTQPVSTRTTTTVASLNISQKRISHTYKPTRSDRKRLSSAQLVQNAMYEALSNNGNADVLVKVNSYVTASAWGRVKAITVSGYPAYYVDFRQPTEADYKNLLTFGATNITEITTPKKTPDYRTVKVAPSSEQQTIVEKKKGIFQRLFGRKNK